MTYSKAIYEEAHRIMDERRSDAEMKAEQYKTKVYSAIPELSDIEREIASLSIEVARAVASRTDTKEKLVALSERSADLQKKYAMLVAMSGFNSERLEPQYNCPLCKDSGVVEVSSKTVYCECFLSLLRKCACDELNKISPLKLSTFSTFSLDHYSFDSETDGVSPYSRMSKIFNYCKNYANSFKGEGRSILMRGATGLGKTHLSLAIANEVINRGYYAVYVSAPSILQKLENSHFNFGSTEEEQILSVLESCDLLIIDDLGTEFMTQYSRSAVYNIFNNRILRNKPVIISTNMTVRELEGAYSQRFLSRIMGNCDKLDFIGRDIRAVKG